jgi:hypothetical protein
MALAAGEPGAQSGLVTPVSQAAFDRGVKLGQPLLKCYELFSDRKNGQIGVARFLGIWPHWHRIS